MRPAVLVENLHYTYPDATPALSDVSLQITPGESVAVIGANGAGKSTLMLLLAGCLMPQSGRITIDNIPLTKKNLPQIRRKIGLVFQNPDDQLFMPTVFEDVAFGPLNLGLDQETIRQRVATALKTVNMEHLTNRPSQKISAGEKHSVAIATILALEPEILMLDEPSSSLDPRNRRHLIELLGSLQQTRIIATHDLDLAWDICERTIIIHNGRIVADGNTRTLLADDELLQECTLERPLRLQ